MGALHHGDSKAARAQGPPFAWSLSSWLADFFQSSMRSCSGLMRLSSSALVNCRSLVSMLRWRMHMRVSAEPMSRVAPRVLVAMSATFWKASKKATAASTVVLSWECSFVALELKSSQMG